MSGLSSPTCSQPKQNKGLKKIQSEKQNQNRGYKVIKKPEGQKPTNVKEDENNSPTATALQKLSSSPVPVDKDCKAP
jgi:hypothetical protein